MASPTEVSPDTDPSSTMGASTVHCWMTTKHPPELVLVVEEHGAVARHTCRRVLVGAMRVVFESASPGTDLLAHRCALT